MPHPIPLGAPIWADSTVPDLASEVAFYTRLFGWTTFDSGEEFGHYTELCLGTSAASARAVAGIAPNQADQPGNPASWGVAFHVRDCVETASHAEKLGATTVTNPLRIGDDLVFATMSDPDGGTFGLFEPLNDDMGFKALSEPGAVAWFEYVYDGVPVEAMQFYAELLDWTLIEPGWEEDEQDAPAVSLRTRADGVEFGACRAARGLEVGMPPRWVVCFAVESVDRATNAAVGLGASVLTPPGDEGDLRTAVLASPAGAVFGIVSRLA